MKRYVAIALIGIACLFASGCAVPAGLAAMVEQAAIQTIIGAITGAM